MTDDILPAESGRAERALLAGAATGFGFPIPVDTLWNPTTSAVALLPWLAWALSVDVWDPSWPEAQQREVIQASFEIHRRKGTLWAVKRALEVLGYGNCEIVEGWRTLVGGPWVVGDSMLVGGADSWADYWVIIHQTVTPAMVTAIYRRLESVAPARCHLTRIIADSVSTVVGGPWAVADVAVTVGSTYQLTE